MSSYFFELADFCNKNGLFQVLMTNGFSSDECLAYNVKKVGINKVMVSLDSSDALKHDKNRGKKDSFRNAIRAMCLYKKNGIDVGIANTVTNDNTHDMKEIYKICSDLQLSTISFLRLREEGKLAYLKDEEEYIDTIKKFIINRDPHIQLKTHDFRLLPAIKELYNQNLITSVEYERYWRMNVCDSKCSLNINPKGEVYKCNFNTRVVASLAKDSPEIILKKFNENYFKCEDWGEK